MSEPDGRMVHSQVRQMGELLEKARRERDEAMDLAARAISQRDDLAKELSALVMYLAGALTDGPDTSDARAALAKARGEG